MSGSPLRARTKFLSEDEIFTKTASGSTSNFGHHQNWWGYRFFVDQVNHKVSGKYPQGICRDLQISCLPRVVQMTQNYNVFPSELYQGYPDLMFPTSYNPYHGIVSAPGYSNLFGEFSNTSTYANLCLEAFNKQIRQVPTRTSLINFAIELSDFKPLLKGLSKIPQRLRDTDASKVLTLQNLRLSRRLPRKVAKSGVDTFLQTYFQWLPFISDIQAFVTSVDTVSRRLDFLRKTKGKPVTIRFHKSDCYIHPQLGQSVYTFNNGSFGFRSHEYVLASYNCEFNSSWTLFHNLSDLDDAWSTLKAVFADLGINNPAKVAWNAIPFSFLVDWVAPFGKWLDRAAIQPFTGQWDISNVSSSFKENAVIEWYFHNTEGSPNSRVLMRTAKISKYHRVDGLPVTLGGIDFTQLSDTQQKLAIAIPLARIL